MGKGITADGSLTIGLDLGDRFTEGRLLDGSGEVVEAFRLRTTEAALGARLGRVDVSVRKPIVHRGERAQRDRILIQAREGLVRARTQLVNPVRGFAKALGTRVPSSSTEAFPKQVRATTPGDLFPGLETLLATIEQLTATIRQMDREVEWLCRERYSETELLRQVPGVGAITALYYVLTIEDPSRFAKSRSVGAYLGLRPKQRDSGEQNPQLRITKAGNRLLRCLLVSGAHYILGPFGPDTDLRRAGPFTRRGRQQDCSTRRPRTSVCTDLGERGHRECGWKPGGSFDAGIWKGGRHGDRRRCDIET